MLVVRPREMQFIIAVLARQLLRLVCLAGSVQTFATLATAALRMLLRLRVQRTSCHVTLSQIATSLLTNWKNSHDTAGLSTASLSCNNSPKNIVAMYSGAALLFREVLDSNLSSIILGLRDVLQSLLAESGGQLKRSHSSFF